MLRNAGIVHSLSPRVKTEEEPPLQGRCRFEVCITFFYGKPLTTSYIYLVLKFMV